MKLNFKSSLFIIILVILTSLLLSGFLGGCSSSILAPKLSPEEKILVENTHIDLIVGVEKDPYSIYSDKLIVALQRTNLFKKVDCNCWDVKGLPVVVAAGICDTTFVENECQGCAIYSGNWPSPAGRAEMTCPGTARGI